MRIRVLVRGREVAHGALAVVVAVVTLILMIGCAWGAAVGIIEIVRAQTQNPPTTAPRSTGVEPSG